MSEPRPPTGEVRVVDDVAAAFADLVVTEGPTTLAVSGGDTARRCYEALARRDDVAWGALHLLVGDERWVPVDHDDSNEGMVRSALAGRIPPATLDSLRDGAGPAANINAAAAAYDAHLGALPALDVVHLGLGEDGHTASLFPGSPALDVDDRLVVATGDDAHPHPRLTLTYPGIARFRLAVFTVEGGAKRDAWARVCGPGDVPAARARAGRIIWLVAPDVAR